MGQVVPSLGTIGPTPWDKSKTARKNEAINSKNRQEERRPPIIQYFNEYFLSAVGETDGII